jgi:hypothetical protein
LNLRHLLLPPNAPQSLLLLKNLPQKSQKRQLKNLLLRSQLQKSLQRRKRQGQVIPQSHIILIVDKVNRAQANCDEVSLPEASDSIGKRSTLEEGEIEAKLLPPHINIELTCIRNGKVIGQPDQGIIDPNMAFDAL